jgi:hypothetical protein
VRAGIACSALLLLALWGWIWILAVGLGQLFSSTEDGACQQPEYLYGAALILVASAGFAASGLGIRRSAGVLLGGTDRGDCVWPTVLTVPLALAATATMTVLKPDFTLVPGAC